MKDKNFTLTQEDIKELIAPMGYGFVSDKITVEGLPIGYMFRENPQDKQDSGWRFFSGTEDDKYMETEENIEVFDVNIIANFDPAIIPYLEASFQTDWERIDQTDTFEMITD